MLAVRVFLVLAFALALGGCTVGYRCHDTATYRAIDGDPSGHAGELVAFRGDVIDVRMEQGGGWSVQVEVAGSPGDVVYIYFPFRKAPWFDRGALASVLGRVDGRVEGLNGFGGPVAMPRLTGVAILANDKVTWDPDEQATVDAWRDGTLFAPSK